MRLLLDTHVVLWWTTDSPRLSKLTRSTLTDFGNIIYVSASSAWEIATKFRIGKLPQAAPLVHTFAQSIKKLGFEELPISMDHAQRAGLLPGHHQDPFDRLLIAQALAENLLIVSNEKQFDAYLVQRVW